MVERFAELSTPLVADACVRLEVTPRAAPAGIRPVVGSDEACVGDLAVLEAAAAGLSGVAVWGLHRDTAELTEDQVLDAAGRIGRTEREQARRIRAGETLREQTGFADYLAARAADPSLTFRQHLRRVGGAIEE